MQTESLHDYPALLQLARALWGQGTARGAAVLVGAGFSRCADRDAEDTPKPPLWTDLASDMKAALYPVSTDTAPTDPLRLAEEYRAYFGQTGLDEFVRLRIQDAAWQPGSLHHSLLSLPWSDVLTTNWDTLLERAARKVDSRHYDSVLLAPDLAHTTAPRIIKLHGSVGTTEHFVLAEEDYRTYPARYAAFVNLARQIFIENELCLLGFSGDDPNFLQWSGWVRDNLGGSARRIFLVGALGLSSAKRKLLEARNVAPIDLLSLVTDEPPKRQHAAALSQLLTFLANAEPRPVHGWEPALDPGYLPKTVEDMRRRHTDWDYAASLLDKATDSWRQERVLYPSWLICPASLRETIRAKTLVVVTQAILEKLPKQRQGEFIYEFSWRHRVSFSPISQENYDIFAHYADPASSSGLAMEKRCEVAVLLLRFARLHEDEEAFDRWATLLRTHAEPESDSHAEAAYQTALRARDAFDFPAMIDASLSIQGRDPAWLLRSAALMADAGNFAQAASLVNDARNILHNRQRTNRTSLWVRSRRAWAQWLARAVRQDTLTDMSEGRWPLEFRASRCDPEDELDYIQAEATRGLRDLAERQVQVIPSFEAGHYRDTSAVVHFRRELPDEPLQTLRLLMETAGIPLRLKYVNIAGSVSMDVAELTFQPAFQWYSWFLRASDGRSHKRFETFFGRIAVARLPGNVAERLAAAAERAVIYWEQRIVNSPPDEAAFATNRLGLFLEVLARITLRLEPDATIASFAVADRIACHGPPHHPMMFEPLDRLARFSIEATPPPDRHRFALRALSFPLAPSGSHPAARRLNPVLALWTIAPRRPEDSVDWAQAVAHLIDVACPGSTQRPEAIVRLAYLAKHRALSDAEATRCAEAVWAQTDPETGIPQQTQLRSFALAELPAPAGVERDAIIRSHLFNTDIQALMSPPPPLSSSDIFNRVEHLQSIARAASLSIQPTRRQAIKLFDAIVSWRPPPRDADDAARIDFLRPLHNPTNLGEALRLTVVPSLELGDRTSDRCHQLLAFIRDLPRNTAGGALPYFLPALPDVYAEIVSFARMAIFGRTEEEVFGAALAIQHWATNAEQCGCVLPPELVDRVLAAVESGRDKGTVAVLGCVRRLAEVGVLSSEQRFRASVALSDLSVDQNYDRVDQDSPRAVVVSLIRAECVRLADALERAGSSSPATQGWLSIAASDPLPEVRFALIPTSSSSSVSEERPPSDTT